MIRIGLIFFLGLFSSALAEEGAPPSGGSPGAANEKETAAKEVTIEDFLQTLSSVDGVVARKDPFQDVGPPFEIPAPVVKGAGPVEEDVNAPVYGAPVLQRYPISDYEVVAVLLGDQYPRALLRIPKEEGSSQKVVIVKEKDKLGNRNGVILRVTQEGLVVLQSLKSKMGFVDKAEVLLKVGGKVEDQRRQLQAARQTGSDDSGGKGGK